MSQDRSHARSVVLSTQGIVATSHVPASQAGALILARGGTAADAAIAANAVLGVTEPMMNGLGGDLFALCWNARTGTLHGLNASGWAPGALEPRRFTARGLRSIPVRGIDSVTVPGVVGGWSKLHQKLGRLPWRDLFQPAIHYAQAGHPVPEIIRGMWESSADILVCHPESRRVFLPEGRVPAVGDVFRNPDLAQALGRIAEHGPEDFYRGEIARAILATSQAHDGTLAPEDLAEYSAEWVEPISTTYRDWTVSELPPNTQGIAALEMLNLMETFPPSPSGPLSTEELHKKIEAMKLAYSDLERYTGDPRFARVPVAGLLSKEYARERARSIDSLRANVQIGSGAPVGSDTVYFCAADREGNIASVIQSNYHSFGSGITVRGMGFVLQNRGALFCLDPEHPNCLAPRKRPFHTIIPGFMQRGHERMAFGIMGGANQPLAHAQFVSNVVDYGMNIQAAMECARFTVGHERGQAILIESRVRPEVLRRLAEMGHELEVRGEYCTLMGRGQAILRDFRAGVNYGASDARADGSAEPEPPPIVW